MILDSDKALYAIDPYAESGGDWYNAQAAVANPFVPKQDTGFVNSLTGLLSKAADTALDLATIKAANKVGSVYPTGQVNPGVVNANGVAYQQQASVNPLGAIMPYVPYIAGGVALILVVALIANRKG